MLCIVEETVLKCELNFSSLPIFKSRKKPTLCFRSIFKESDEMDCGSESELALLQLLALSVLALAADGLRLPLWTDHFIIAAVRFFSRHTFTNPLLIGVAIQPIRRSELGKTQTTR